jgi:hypothetical protein
MDSMGASELSQQILSSLTEGIDGLHRCARLDLDSDSLRQLLTHAFGQRNRLDAALTGLIGELDQRCREENQEGLQDPSPSCATCSAASSASPTPRPTARSPWLAACPSSPTPHRPSPRAGSVAST